MIFGHAITWALTLHFVPTIIYLVTSLAFIEKNPSNIVGVIYFINTICQKNTCNIDKGTIILSSIQSWISKKFHPVVASVFFIIMYAECLYLSENNSSR